MARTRACLQPDCVIPSGLALGTGHRQTVDVGQRRDELGDNFARLFHFVEDGGFFTDWLDS